MQNVKKIVVIVCLTVFASGACFSGTITDKYGRKTGSYQKQSNGTVVEQDKYGRKVGSYKKKPDGTVVKYDKYGRKVGSFK